MNPPYLCLFSHWWVMSPMRQIENELMMVGWAFGQRDFREEEKEEKTEEIVERETETQRNWERKIQKWPRNSESWCLDSWAVKRSCRDNDTWCPNPLNPQLLYFKGFFRLKNILFLGSDRIVGSCNPVWSRPIPTTILQEERSLTIQDRFYRSKS